MDEHRARRVSEAVREELSEIVGFELGDPRLEQVDVTDVLVTPDLRNAQVKVALLGTEVKQIKALQALDHARHYLRAELARRLSLRRVPELHFSADAAAGAENRVETLLRRARNTRGRSENPA